MLVKHIEALRLAFHKAKQKHPFTIDAIVILPDHLHTIWTLPVNDHDYPKRWQAIKSYFYPCFTKTRRNTRQKQTRRI